MSECNIIQMPSSNRSNDNFPLDDFFRKYEDCDSDDDPTPTTIINELKSILQKHPDALAKRNREGDLPIHTVCKNEWLPYELLEFIINANTDMVKEKDKDGRYPLSLVCETAFDKCRSIEAMIRIFPVAAFSRDKNGDSPLHLLTEGIDNSPCSEYVEILVEVAPEMVSIPCSDGIYLVIKACNCMLKLSFTARATGHSFFSMPDNDDYRDSLYNLQYFLKYSHTNLITKAMEFLLDEITIVVEQNEVLYLHNLMSMTLQYVIQAKTSGISSIKNYTGNPFVNRTTLMIDAFHIQNGLPNLTLPASRVMFGAMWPDRRQMAAVKDQDGNYALHHVLKRIQKTNQSHDFITTIKWVMCSNPQAVSSKDNEGYYPLHLCLKYGAPLDLVVLVFRFYPAAIYFLNHFMDDTGFNIEIVGTYDVSLDVIFYLMQQDISCIVGRFKKKSLPKFKKQKTNNV